MKFIEYLGGRKFILSVLLIGVGTLIEIKTERGVSASFAGLLVGILGAFSAANAMITGKLASLGSEASEVIPPSLPSPDPAALDEVKKQIEEASKITSETLANVATSVANTNKILNVLLQR